MSDRRPYANPPIEEALCEFQFAAGEEWDLTMPGKLHTELAREYPAKPKQQRLARVDLEFEEGRAKGVRLEDDVGKVLLRSEDRTRLVGVGQDTLSVHMLRPYQRVELRECAGWGEFSDRINTALGAYWTVARPAGVQRVVVRYINKIVIPDTALEVGDYLRSVLPDIPGLPETALDFASRVVYHLDEGVQLGLSQGGAHAAGGQQGVLLDIDVSWESSSYLDVEMAMAQAKALRDREREAFERVITDKARDLFDAA